MFTLTQAFLDAYPNWATAQGWQAGNQVDIASFLINLQSDTAKSFINAHPPHKPVG